MTGGRLFDLVNIQTFWNNSAVAELPNWAPAGDDQSDGQRSTLRLFEDGLELGPPHTQHDLLEQVGEGCFSHWGHQLFFTASDGTHPATNNRRYTALVHTRPLSPIRHMLTSIEDTYPQIIQTDAGYTLLENLTKHLEPGTHLSERGRSYFSDEEFRADYERFDNRNYRSYDRKFAIREFARYAARLNGDMAECGVWRGGSAWLMAKALRAAGRQNRLHIFDSFAGLSQPTSVDGAHWNAGDLAVPIERVRENLAPVEDVIQYWPGWIPNEFRHVAGRRFSLVHIDVDLAEPTWDSLEFFYPRVVDGGLIVCDDYGFDTCPGARKAMDAFAVDHEEQVIHLPTGQGVIIRRSPRS